MFCISFGLGSFALVAASEGPFLEVDISQGGEKRFREKVPGTFLQTKLIKEYSLKDYLIASSILHLVNQH